MVLPFHAIAIFTHFDVRGKISRKQMMIEIDIHLILTQELVFFWSFFFLGSLKFRLLDFLITTHFACMLFFVLSALL